MVTAFLRVKQSRKKLYFTIINQHADEIDDLALDILAPLFCRNREGRFVRFEQYFTPILGRIKSNPTEAYIQLKRLISSHVDQELIELLKKEDPDGWKFYRNIILAPQRNPHIHVIDIQNTCYLLYHDDPSSDPWDSIDGNLPEIDLSTLKIWLSDAMHDAKTTPAFIGNVLRTIKEDLRYASQVPLASMHSALKHILGITTVPLDRYEPSDDRDLLPVTKDSLLSSLKLHIQQQLETVYRKPGKLPDNILERYQSVLDTYFEDLIWMGQTNALVKYMNHNPENKILKVDWNKHKSRLEYMVKKGRDYLQFIFRQN
ncbi:MAG: hypothetical protein GXO90_07660 [FCB group bacterium]|nr:hypothetical protein [FCB group bacterium]